MTLEEMMDELHAETQATIVMELRSAGAYQLSIVHGAQNIGHTSSGSTSTQAIEAMIATITKNVQKTEETLGVVAELHMRLLEGGFSLDAIQERMRKIGDPLKEAHRSTKWVLSTAADKGYGDTIEGAMRDLVRTRRNRIGYPTARVDMNREFLRILKKYMVSNIPERT